MLDLTIRAPGAYDIPIDAYHSQICDGPSISSSGLRKIREKSPAHFWATSDLNPDRIIEEPNKALNFGKAAHALLLESKLPEAEFALTPFSGGYNVNDNKNGWKAGEKREWKEQQEAAGKAIVSADDLAVITQMAEALGKHHLVRDGILRGDVERSLFWKPDFADKDGEVPDVWLKARPDVVPHDTIIADYKTAEDASVNKMIRVVADRGYHMQLAMMADGIENVLGRTIEQAALIVQEKKPPYVVAVRFLHQSYLIAGRMEYRAATHTFNECLKRNEWPGYPDADLHVPGWLEKKLENEEV